MAADDSGPQELPGAVLRWCGSVAHEVVHAPTTVAHLRQLLQGIADLPAQLERVVDSVESTTAPLSGSLEDVAAALAEISDRLDRLDSVIWHLRDTLVAVIGAVPGAGRVLDRLPPPPPATARGRAGGALSSSGSPSVEYPPGDEGYDAP